MEEQFAAHKCPLHDQLGRPKLISHPAIWVTTLFIAVVLGAFVATVFSRGMRTKTTRKQDRKQNRVAGVANAREVMHGDIELDAIIVGAGVAGSALAHTLGKVCYCSARYFCSYVRGFRNNVGHDEVWCTPDFRFRV